MVIIYIMPRRLRKGGNNQNKVGTELDEGKCFEPIEGQTDIKEYLKGNEQFLCVNTETGLPFCSNVPILKTILKEENIVYPCTKVFEGMLSAFGDNWKDGNLIYAPIPMIHLRKLGLGYNGVVSVENVEKVLIDKVNHKLFTIEPTNTVFKSMIAKELTGTPKANADATGRAHCQEGQEEKAYVIWPHHGKYNDTEYHTYKPRYVGEATVGGKRKNIRTHKSRKPKSHKPKSRKPKTHKQTNRKLRTRKNRK